MSYAMSEQSGAPDRGDLYSVEESESQMPHFLAAVAQVDVSLQQFYRAHQTGGLPELITPAYILEEGAGQAPFWATQVANWQHAVPEFSLMQHSRLARLAECYQLTDFELTVVIVGCLNAFEPRYQQLFLALPFQRNGQPSLELVLAVFCAGAYARQAYEQSFSASASLLRYGLIELHPNKVSGWHLFETPDWVRLWLLGEYRLPSPLEAVTRWLMPQPDGASSDLDMLDGLGLEPFPPLLEIRCAPGADSEASLGTLAQRMGTSALSTLVSPAGR